MNDSATIDDFATFDIEELGILEIGAGTALPEMGASNLGWGMCCSSSSASSCCC